MWQGFSLVELSIVLVKRICHSVARVFAKAKTVNPESCREKIPAFAGMTTKSGFSLIELSIVLVIIGLVVGGILMGQNLIRNAEMKSVTTELSRYKQAAAQFQDKYLALPGDLPDAHDYWGSAGGSGVVGDGCEAATGTGTQTCSGNGDGVLNPAPAAGQYGERFTFWQHLVNAGFIEGGYAGMAGATFEDAVIGVNIPRSGLSNAGWAVWHAVDGYSDVNWFPFSYEGNVFFVGAEVAGYSPIAAALTVEEAWNIDTKIDDGNAVEGKVVTWKGGTSAAPNCATTDVVATAEYNLTFDGVACSLIFRDML